MREGVPPYEDKQAESLNPSTILGGIGTRFNCENMRGKTIESVRKVPQEALFY